MTYLLPPINSAVASKSLMLVFQSPHPLGQLAKRFLVSVFSGALVVGKASLSTAAAKPYPSAKTIFIF
jgi:hypothetical protein